MESYREFSPESTDILFYKPKSHVNYRQGGRRFLLWPVYAYRVLAPKPRPSALNIFQKAVLGFCRTGESKKENIAKILHLDIELVDTVLSELRVSNLINPDFSLTSKGGRILDEELDELPAEIVNSFVFQDPWTGKLWPRIVEHREYARAEYEGDSRYPTLLIGSKGSNRRFKPFVKTGDQDVMPRTPQVSEILDARRQYEKDKRKVFQSLSGDQDFSTEEEDDGFSYSPIEDPEFKSITIIDEEPELFFLTTYVYIPDYRLHSLEWYVCDPFGYGASSSLRKSIERLMSKDPNLKKFIDEFIQDVLGETQQYEDEIVTLQSDAKTFIQRELTDLIELYPFYNQLLAMERSFQECLRYEMLNEDCPKDKLGDVLVKAGISLEAVFRYFHSKYQVKDAWKIYDLPNWKDRNSILNEIAASLGFAAALPTGLAGIPPADIRRACNSGGGTLGERLIANLLIAHRVPEHPFHRTASVLPKMFVELKTIMRLRGLSAHDTDSDTDLALVTDQRSVTYKVIRELLCIEINNGGSNE